MIHVLVALGISTVVVSGTAAFLGNSYRHVASVSQNLDRESLLADLRLSFSSSEVCNSLSIVGQTISGSEISLQELSQGTVTLLKKDTSGADATAKEIKVAKRGDSIFTRDGAVPSEKLHLFPMSLVLQFENAKGALQISPKPREIHFYAYLDDSGKIKSCFGGYENSQAQQNCEVLLGGIYDPNPNPGRPHCTMKPAFKDYEGVGVRTTTAFAGTLSFVGGSGKVTPWGAFNEYEMTAPDCPAGTVPVACRVHMKTEVGQNQVFDTMSFDVDAGDPLLPSGSVPVNWYLAYFDQANLDGEKRPRCTLRIANPTSNGTWAEWYPRVTCGAQSEVFLPK